MSSESDSKATSTPDSSTGGWFNVGFGVLVVAALIGSALFLSARGGASRFVEADTRQVSTSRGLVDATDDLRARGVVVLGASAHLGYTPVELKTPPNALKWPIEERDLNAYFRAGVSRDSWVWVLAKTGVARRIDYLMPEAEYARRVAEGRAKGFPGISADGTSILANDEGYLRHISDRISREGGPLLLVVDASYFDFATPDELFARLSELSTLPTAVVMNAAKDDPNVSDAARATLEALRPRLEAMVRRP